MVSFPDKENFYLCFKVKDDIVVNRYKGNAKMPAYGGDCIELFLDVLGSGSSSPEPEFFQYFFGLNNRISLLPDSKTGRVSADTKAKMAYKKTKDGYNLELSIPLEEIFLKGLRKDYRISFDVFIDDADGSEQRDDKKQKIEYVLGWHGVGYHTCRFAGDMIFVTK